MFAVFLINYGLSFRQNHLNTEISGGLALKNAVRTCVVGLKKLKLSCHKNWSFEPHLMKRDRNFRATELCFMMLCHISRTLWISGTRLKVCLKELRRLIRCLRHLPSSTATFWSVRRLVRSGHRIMQLPVNVSVQQTRRWMYTIEYEYHLHNCTHFLHTIPFSRQSG